MQVITVGYISPIDTRMTVVLANSAAETTVLGHTVTANYLPTFTSIGFRATLLVSTANASTLTIKIKFGASTLTIVSSTLGLALNNAVLRVEASITNQGSNTQAAWGEIRQTGGTIFTLLSAATTESAATGWAVDTTLDTLAQMTVQFGTANAGNKIQMIQGTMTFG